MKKSLCVLAGLFVFGCSSAQLGDYGYDPATDVPAPMDLPRQSLTSIDELQNGMTYPEVMELMGDQVKIGFQKSGEEGDSADAVGLRNPYQIEMVEAGDGQHLVVYYVTSVNNSDGQITNDELTPVVFTDNVMVGKGWDYLNELKSM